MSESAKAAGFRQPAEWTTHGACWVAWPSLEELWPSLAEVQASFTAMCRGIAHSAGATRGERLEVLVRDAEARKQAEQALAGLDVRFHEIVFGDIWMRDIAPVFLTDRRGEVASVRFRFNGWGGKYLYEGDDRVASQVQDALALPKFSSWLTCEGGAVECDGEGLLLTTRDVVLNPNRNPGRSEAEVTQALEDAFGASRVVYVDNGLLNDHTDGHIDNTARIIGVNRVLCMRPQDGDPNREVLGKIERELHAAGLDVVTLGSPGLVTGRDGHALPASYLNFYIANASVVVPVFGSPHDDEALAAIEALFPGRTVFGVPAKVLVQEGGTVHCITQQEPKAP
jgi:agmatine deiminase